MVEKKADAILLVQPVNSVVDEGQDAEVEIELRNNGTKSLWVNGRLLVNSAHVPKQYRELAFEIIGPTGDSLDFQSKVRAGEASAEHYSVLECGKSVTATVRVGKYFDMDQRGDYRITAIYADGTETVPPASGESQHLAGPIKSSEVGIRVLAPED